MSEAEGDITDVPGIRVGHWTDEERLTGCTVVLAPDGGAVASADVRGAAPGTRETDLLRPGASVERVHAVLLAGGSAFGLAAADGVMGYLAERDTGFDAGVARVPIVPAAVLFDLGVGDPAAYPRAEAGRAACEAAERGEPCGSGRRGAGTGATVGKLLGPEKARPGGLGTASRRLPSGGIIGAVAAVNALGDVLAEDGRVLAGPGAGKVLLDGAEGVPRAGENTTLVVLATDVALTKDEAHRLAEVAHDGFARTIHPVHTAYDGDTAFVLSTGDLTEEPLVLHLATVEMVSRAIRNAVQ